MRTLLIDNYDSFTYNLYQLLAVVNGTEPLVFANDDSDWKLLPSDSFDNIVISPGPGHPARERDFGASLQAIHQSRVPVLGVCLGHQGICHAFGGLVDHSPQPVHGRRSEIFHTGTDVFEGVPSPFSAVRYHSLIASELPMCLEQIAWTADGLCMALRHTSRPIWGVQYHPESVCTEHGRRILENFRDFTATRQPSPRVRSAMTTPNEIKSENPASSTAASRDWVSVIRDLPPQLDAESTFLELYGGSDISFWLDSSAVIPGASRFSFMGDNAGPHAEQVSYDVASQTVTKEFGGTTPTFRGAIFDFLEEELKRKAENVNDGPVPFMGGYVGYIGYEVKADCGGDRAYASTDPDAMFLFADRLIAFDHQEGRAYAVALCTEATRKQAEEWFSDINMRLSNVSPSSDLPLVPGDVPQIYARHSSNEYLRMVDACKEEIRNGESYEVCLTNMVTADPIVDPLLTYRALRRCNPAPYAAFLRFGSRSILSASPERFLSIGSAGAVESKPIKGTRRRGVTEAEDAMLREELATSEKDRSENLMIVDLVRNDLGTVCVPGSVHVPSLFEVESYATVHQLVSTVRGQLRPGFSPVACFKAAFPGGSMTGAPKKRTMEILDRLEKGPRGIYSGALGFFGVTGQSDFSIVIRTLIATPRNVSFGVGGAVVALSDADNELAEVWVKARALLHALAITSNYVPVERPAIYGSGRPSKENR